MRDRRSDLAGGTGHPKYIIGLVSTAAAAAKSLQSCPTLCDPIDGSLPGSAVPGILQARTLEWVAISFSNAWKWKVKVKLFSFVRLFVTPWTAACQAPLSMGFSSQEYLSGVPLPSLLRGFLKLGASSLRFFGLLSGSGDGEGQESTSVGICQDIPLAQPPTWEIWFWGQECDKTLEYAAGFLPSIWFAGKCGHKMLEIMNWMDSPSGEPYLSLQT